MNKIEISVMISLKEIRDDDVNIIEAKAEIKGDKVTILSGEMLPRQFRFLSDIQYIVRDYLTRNKR